MWWLFMNAYSFKHVKPKTLSWAQPILWWEINYVQESVLDLGQLLTSKYKLIQVSDLTRAGWKPNVAHSPGQAKRHPGYRVLEQSRPERAKALRHGASIEQNIHTVFHFKTAKSAIKQE